MKVFLSSTVFDLLDVRAELAEFLRSLGATPLLSDEKLSGFKVLPDANSIETCLVNVRASDQFILILDQRYGPPLGNAGFPDVSATHLEYRTAVEAGIPIHVFARNRLLAEHGIWKKNRKKKGSSASVDFLWVTEVQDRRLFELIEEHSKLNAKGSRSNWRHSFSTSVDLKAAIEQSLAKPLLTRKLVDAIAATRFPLFDGVGEKKELSSPDATVLLSAEFRNVGGSPAFNVVFSGPDDQHREFQVLHSGGTAVFNIFVNPSVAYESEILLTYDSSLGVTVAERWKVTASFVRTPSSLPTHAVIKMRPEPRTFKYGQRPEIKIDDS